jgi:hypothetical protein
MPRSNSANYVPTEDRGITLHIFEQLFSWIQQVDQLILQNETIQNDVLYMSQNNFVTHQNALMIIKFQHFMYSPELWQLANNWSQYMHRSLSLTLALLKVNELHGADILLHASWCIWNYRKRGTM